MIYYKWIIMTFCEEDMGIVTKLETFSAEETFEVGKRIGESATPGMVYTLVGDLGVGKTDKC